MHDRSDAGTVRITHPYGVMEATVRATIRDGQPAIQGVIVSRTARHNLDGVVHVDRGLFG
ncbi:MAG TPA: hypothetical protein VIM25_06650 [Candidatus Limnocylindrales bacterium]